MFPFFVLMPFFRHSFFASHRMKWNCIEKRDYVSGSMRSVITLQIYLKQFYCVCQTKSTLELCTISLSSPFFLSVALLCTFTFNVLRSFVKTKSNICQAIEKNECKTLEIEIRRVSALFALPPKCSMSDATAKHTHLPAYSHTKWLRADAYDLDENHHGIKRERERILWQWRQKQCWIRISSSSDQEMLFFGVAF